jgi:hypothetical protein
MPKIVAPMSKILFSINKQAEADPGSGDIMTGDFKDFSN